MNIKDTVEADAKSFWARNKTHILGYPITFVVGTVIHWVLGKLL